MPARYTRGCVPPDLVAGARSVNEGRLAVAFGKCDRLQRDTTTWLTSYLKGLAGK